MNSANARMMPGMEPVDPEGNRSTVLEWSSIASKLKPMGLRIDLHAVKKMR